MEERKFNNSFMNDGNVSFFEQGLNHLKGMNDLRFLEIGSWEGESSCWYLDNILTGDNCSITCVDSWEGGEEHTNIMETIESNFLSNIESRRTNVEILKGYSKEMLLSIQDRKGYYDFVYVDGGHTLKDVITDLILSFDLVKPGGIIGMDDFMWGSPQYKVGDPKPDHMRPEHAIRTFVTAFTDEIEVIAQGGQVWVKKL